MLTKDGPGSLPSKKVKASIGCHFIDYQTLYHKKKTRQVYYGVKQNLKKIKLMTVILIANDNDQNR